MPLSDAFRITVCVCEPGNIYRQSASFHTANASVRRSAPFITLVLCTLAHSWQHSLCILYTLKLWTHTKSFNYSCGRSGRWYHAAGRGRDVQVALQRPSLSVIIITDSLQLLYSLLRALCELIDSPSLTCT